MFDKLNKSYVNKNDDYHLKNIEFLLNNKISTINYLRLLTDSILGQQLGVCIGAECLI
ncbi:MAG: hypothetical protein PHX08_17155 [Lachnospiraceae bacterium]|nr:hypothetical protein [Lachnospiraceae bacterium]